MSILTIAEIVPVVDGVVVVDKPEDWTSHDVVARLRRIFGTRRTGHLGTLDPIATGVLPVMVGQATRLAQFFDKSEKAYEAVIRFGFATTTYDRAGEVCGPISEPAFTQEQLESALMPLRGPIDQQPPPVSAKKIKGVPAYKLARRNAPAVLALAPVRVEVYELTLTSFDGNRAGIRVRCSPGTYIRSLAHDLGRSLGCGAHIDSLRRTGSGPFQIESGRTIATLEELAAAGRLSEALIPAAELLPEFPAVLVDEIASSHIRQGRDFAASPFRINSNQEYVKAIGPDGRLVAIGRIVIPHLYHPMAVFT